MGLLGLFSRHQVKDDVQAMKMSSVNFGVQEVMGSGNLGLTSTNYSVSQKVQI